MKRDDILKLIRQLAFSQGFYSRLYGELMDCKENDPSSYDDYMSELEAKNFASDLDVVLFFET